MALTMGEKIKIILGRRNMTLAQLAEKNDIAGLKTVQGMQDKAFRQAQMSARELGLTITARAKLVIPTFPDEDEEL